ncbi:MAG: threonine--tRNA ligase [Candidatus Paceibacterota bacterium]
MKDNLEKIRHSLSHLMAMAVLEKFPKTKLGIGPVIENGFYYDFDTSISDTDLPKIEKRMRELIRQDLKFKKEVITLSEAKKLFRNEPYKLELIKELHGSKKPITTYTTSSPRKSASSPRESAFFVDLCAGPHIKSTKEINPDAFKLTKIAGAYWKGDEKNQMLTRIYGVAFNNKKELDEYLKLQEEAEKRDHRKLGKELDLFSFHDEGHGFPFWHAKGTILYSQLENFIRKENEKRGYKEVKTPIILNKKLWETSGHWEKFKDDMYFIDIDDQEFAVKPMNCPGTTLIYKEKLHSYRDLPVRYAEFGLVHRHELSGVLHGLFRARSFTQDDAHSYCAPKQLNDEIINMVDYAVDVYKAFGFNEYEIFIATKPEKYIGDNNSWEKATEALNKALKEKKLNYEIKKGEGAFYGPKIEFNVKDAIGRNWQLGTIQVDFSMPQRFNAFYIDEKGNKQIPVMIHRAILGSLERFIGILIEHYAGALPVWLSPIQTIIIPVSEKFNNYGEKILKELKNNNIRGEIDNSNETLGKRIRNAEIQKIPYILIVGEKEIKSNNVAVRSRDDKQNVVKLEKFLEKILKENAALR